MTTRSYSILFLKVTIENNLKVENNKKLIVSTAWIRIRSKKKKKRTAYTRTTLA